jgi:hypothetical protein
MKTWKRIILGVMIMAAAGGMEGCAVDREKFEKQALDMLAAKYGETFYLAQYHGSDYFGNEYEVTAYSEEYPEVLFKCTGDRGGTYIEDEYVAARVSADVEEKMSAELGTLPGYYFLKAEPLSKSIASADAGMTPEEFMGIKPSDRFLLMLHYCPADRDARAVYQAVEAAVQKEPALSGTVRLTITDEETLKKVEEYFGQNAGIYDEYDQLVKDSPVMEIRFSKGQLQTKETDFAEEAGNQV